MSIRPARPEDLPSLVERLARREYFADRLDRQAGHRGVLLIAWQDDLVIGDAYLWLEPAEEPEIRIHLPGTPLFTQLEIHPAHRSRGAGTRLIQASERLLAQRGYEDVALAIEVSNVETERLCRRLGFLEWPHGVVNCYSSVDDNGHRMAEACKVLIKKLAT
ncbi:GNAT family N-acetyltransferase [Lentzea sp. NPDC003310]|uniref:GNAT family N-acetyltransferase n=1 Tax=Lentzea sp. NPDC003310 TaxID=3154447 RepID=UPI0033B9963A